MYLKWFKIETQLQWKADMKCTWQIEWHQYQQAWVTLKVISAAWNLVPQGSTARCAYTWIGKCTLPLIFNCRIETEWLFRVSGSHVHCKPLVISWKSCSVTTDH